MMQPDADGLILQVAGGEAIPCSAGLVTVKLTGEAAGALDPELVRNAASAVLHFFKVERGKTFVSIGEFSQALARALRGFGLNVRSAPVVETPRRLAETDLRRLACESGQGFELAFFPLLREELRHQLNQSPHVVHFTGLRSCVKQLAGARRWSDRCQRLNDRIVEYLRDCLSADPGARSCSVVLV